jgi:hypothetical protein
MVANLFNIVGLILDMAGVLILIWQGQKTTGVTGGLWEVAHMQNPKTNNPIGHRYVSGFYLGCILLGGGFFLQCIGNIIALVSRY